MPVFKLKRSGGPRDMEISMAGLKLGSSVLQIQGRDGGLIAALAGKVGLSGAAYAVAVDQEQASSFKRTAAAEGVLVEVTVAPLNNLPFEAESFDLVVLKDMLGQLRQHVRVACLQQTHHVLRPGGRCLVIEKAIRGGLGALWSKQSFDQQYAMFGGAQGALSAEGFRGVRVLANRDGVSFTEGSRGAQAKSNL